MPTLALLYPSMALQTAVAPLASGAAVTLRAILDRRHLHARRRWLNSAGG